MHLWNCKLIDLKALKFTQGLLTISLIFVEAIDYFISVRVAFKLLLAFRTSYVRCKNHVLNTVV